MKTVNIKLFTIFSVALLLCGCSKTSSSKNRVVTWEDLSNSVVYDRQVNSVLWEYVTNLDLDVKSASKRITNLENENYAVFVQPDNQTYSTLKTDVGNLLVATEKVEPYLDGFKITLRVGNPYKMDIYGPNIILNTYTNLDLSDFRSITNKSTETLAGGAWTLVPIILTPANMQEVRNCSVIIEASEISLTKPSSP